MNRFDFTGDYFFEDMPKLIEYLKSVHTKYQLMGVEYIEYIFNRFRDDRILEEILEHNIIPIFISLLSINGKTYDHSKIEVIITRLLAELIARESEQAIMIIKMIIDSEGIPAIFKLLDSKYETIWKNCLLIIGSIIHKLPYNSYALLITRPLFTKLLELCDKYPNSIFFEQIIWTIALFCSHITFLDAHRLCLNAEFPRFVLLLKSSSNLKKSELCNLYAIFHSLIAHFIECDVPKIKTIVTSKDSILKDYPKPLINIMLNYYSIDLGTMIKPIIPHILSFLKISETIEYIDRNEKALLLILRLFGNIFTWGFSENTLDLIFTPPSLNSLSSFLTNSNSKVQEEVYRIFTVVTLRPKYMRLIYDHRDIIAKLLKLLNNENDSSFSPLLSHEYQKKSKIYQILSIMSGTKDKEILDWLVQAGLIQSFMNFLQLSEQEDDIYMIKINLLQISYLIRTYSFINKDFENQLEIFLAHENTEVVSLASKLLQKLQHEQQKK